MQWYWVLNAIYKIYPESDLKSFYARMKEDPKQDSLKSAQSPRELLMEHFLVPFILSSLKELKCEFLQFLIQPEMAKLIESMKIIRGANDLYDFSKLSNEQYYAFRHAFVTERMYCDALRVEENPRAMDLLLSTLCMIICGKVPKGIVPFKLDQLIPKIRLVQAPRTIELRDRYVTDEQGNQTKIEKSTNERAVIRILVPKRKMTMSEIDAENDNNNGRKSAAEERAKTPASGDDKKEAEEGEEKKDTEVASKQEAKEEQIVEKWVESDQDDKVALTGNRIIAQQPGYHVLLLNQYAARAHR